MVEEIEGKWKRVRSCVKYGDVRVVFIEEVNHACVKALSSTHTSIMQCMWRIHTCTHACVNACDTYIH